MPVPTKYFMISPNTSPFFQVLLICWQIFNYFLSVRVKFGDLQLILMCFTMDGGFKCFSRTRYHILPRVT